MKIIISLVFVLAACQPCFPQSDDITVALLDTGVDVEHPGLKPFLWTNPGEIPGNNIDDDGNGYMDDVNGWNFLGNGDGSFNLTRVGTQAFREYKRLRPKYKNVSENDKLSRKKREEWAYYKQMERRAGINSYLVFAEYLGKVAESFMICDSLLEKGFSDKNSVGAGALVGLAEQFQGVEETERALDVVLQRYMLEEPDISWKEIYDKNVSAYELAQERIISLDVADDDPRSTVGDNISDFGDTRYGNNMMYLADSGQCTALAGVIVAAGGEHVRIMTVRVVPTEGDAYDKDIAIGIKYAVDNGAKIISIGAVKSISPDAGEVRRAIEYAARQDVLIVRAAGDDGEDVDMMETFPSLRDRKGRRYDNIIVVGASDDNGMPAVFSNYGQHTVDIFVPGVGVRTTYPGNQYVYVEGTDVSGAAVKIRSRFPELTAPRVREIARITVH